MRRIDVTVKLGGGGVTPGVSVEPVALAPAEGAPVALVLESVGEVGRGEAGVAGVAGLTPAPAAVDPDVPTAPVAPVAPDAPDAPDCWTAGVPITSTRVLLP
jgi:hypothetical protein